MAFARREQDGAHEGVHFLTSSQSLSMIKLFATEKAPEAVNARSGVLGLHLHNLVAATEQCAEACTQYGQDSTTEY